MEGAPRRRSRQDILSRRLPAELLQAGFQPSFDVARDWLSAQLLEGRIDHGDSCVILAHEFFSE
jgi:hypothetical protein